jgi:hypothetical protein
MNCRRLYHSEITVTCSRIQSWDCVKQFLTDNPELCEDIEAQIRENA